jgi:hypothetical protein
MSKVLETPQQRKLFTFDYTSGATVRKYSPDFPRSLYSKLMLVLAGNLTKTESSAGTLADNAFSLLRAIRLIADGETIKEFEPRVMRVYSHHVCRGQDTDATMITLGSDTAERFEARLELDFQFLRTRAPWLGYFPAYRYNQIGIELDWGAYTELVNGGTYSGVSFSTSPTLEVWGEEIQSPQAYNFDGYILHKVQQRIYALNSVANNIGSEARYELPIGEVYRGILVHAFKRSPDLAQNGLLQGESGTTYDSLIVRVNGTFRRVETNWYELRRRNKARYGIAMPSGFAFIDFVEDGDLYKTLRADEGISSVEFLASNASVASAFLGLTLFTMKKAK